MQRTKSRAAIMVLAALMVGTTQAGKGHDKAGGSMQSAPGTPAHASQAMPMDGGHDGVHAHDIWPSPPAAFADGIAYAGWDDRAAARRGRAIFQRQCAACHGADGRGTGPAAAALEHKPADLTRHFHVPGKRGDAYLYWRITEGGQAAPFADTGSMMPAFGTTLTGQQRWDVLTFVHQAFHASGQLESQVGHGADHDEEPSHDG